MLEDEAVTLQLRSGEGCLRIHFAMARQILGADDVLLVMA